MSPAGSHMRARGEDGFTLIEILIAMVLLIVGLLALFTALDTAVRASAITKAQQGAVTLAREVTEDAHAIPYDQVVSGTLVNTLQTFPGLASGSSSSWQVTRAGTTYTITASVCSIDDPKDGYGVHDSSFCSDSSQTGTADSQPADLKRITVNVAWTTANGLSHTFQQTSTVSSAGQAAALTASNLQMASPTAGSTWTGTAGQPTIISTSVTALTFSATVPTGTTAVEWTVNGTTQTWSTTISGTTATSSSWNISGLSDGTYTVGAAAENSSGVIGPPVTIPVTLSRSIPAAPTVTAWGFNQNLCATCTPSGGTPITAAELQWQGNSELNVTGYQITSPSRSQTCTTSASTVDTSCGTNWWCMTETSCIDLAPPSVSAGNLTYQVLALYRDANHNTAYGPATSVTLTGADVTHYALAPSSTYGGTNCSGSVARDLLTSYTAGSDTTQTGGTIMFCSPPFYSGEQVGSGGSATVYVANPGTSACTITATQSVDGSSTGANSVQATIPAGTTTPTAVALNFGSGSVMTMGTGDQLTLNVDMSAASCSSAVLHYGGTSYPGTFNTGAVSVPSPASPTGLSLSVGSGTATLTWTASAGTTPVSLYRIYRDGPNYTNRYDYVSTSTCGATCSYTDPHHSGSHSYYVTAVGNTTTGSDEAESPALGPVTG